MCFPKGQKINEYQKAPQIQKKVSSLVSLLAAVEPKSEVGVMSDTWTAVEIAEAKAAAAKTARKLHWADTTNAVEQALHDRIAKLETALENIRVHTYPAGPPGYRCNRCTDVQSMVRKALEKDDE